MTITRHIRRPAPIGRSAKIVASQPEPTSCHRIAGPGFAKRHGFTLIELIIVMALIAIMAGLGYPTLQKQLVRVRTMTSARQITATFQRARLEAIRRNTPGTVEIDIAGRRVVADVDGVTFVGLLAAGVEFGAPSGLVGDIVDGFEVGDGKANFTIAGGVLESGAFRIVGPHGNNFVEVKIDPPATARIQILKWDVGSDTFKAQGEGGVSWTW